MAMVYGFEKLKHIMGSHFLTKSLAFLVTDFIKHFLTFHVLHNQVQIFLVIVSFKIVHDVGVIKFIQNIDLFHELTNMFL